MSSVRGEFRRKSGRFIVKFTLRRCKRLQFSPSYSIIYQSAPDVGCCCRWHFCLDIQSAAAEVCGSRINIREVSNMASDKRVKVCLACSECKQRNYNTMKNKKNDPDRLEMHKYCRFCKKHTSHKETK